MAYRGKKQYVVSKSSAKVEFKDIAHGLCEFLWIKIILSVLRVSWEGSMKALL